MIVGQVLIIMIGGRALQVVHLNGAQWDIQLSLVFSRSQSQLSPDAFQMKFFKGSSRRWWSQIARHRRVVSNGSQQTDWDSALLKLREEMELVS